MVIQELRREFKRYTEKNLEIRTATVRKISAQYFKKIRKRSKHEKFKLCEDLLESDNWMDRVVAFDWAYRCKSRYEKADFYVFESWLKRYVSGWGSCDDFCTHAFGHFLFNFPEFFSNVKLWAKSRNRWLRRASAVILIYSIRRKRLLASVFEIADTLLLDKDDLVQKGYGWMLKEASKNYPEEVFSYVMKHRKEMPRTALRYSIEKLSSESRIEAMKKDFKK